MRKAQSEKINKVKMVKLTIRLPETVRDDMELIHTTLKYRQRNNIMLRRKLFVQDLYIEALTNYTNMVKKKLDL